MSKCNLHSALFVLTLLATAPLTARADAYDDGMNAYQAGDYRQALQQWKLLAERGHAQALYNLGFMYEFGYGVAPNDEHAFNHYLRAAQNGHTQAQHTVAWMYERGKGVTADRTQATRWADIAAHTAARANGSDAQRLLEQLQMELPRAAARYDQQKARKSKLPVELEASNQTS